MAHITCNYNEEYTKVYQPNRVQQNCISINWNKKLVIEFAYILNQSNLSKFYKQIYNARNIYDYTMQYNYNDSIQ